MFLQKLPLVVQWLRLHAPNAGAQVQSPIRELDPIYHPMTKRFYMPQ